MLGNLIRQTNFVLGCPLKPVKVVGERRITAKLLSMMNFHPLKDTFTALQSSFSDKLLHPKCVNESYHRSFLPAAVRLTNERCCFRL